jgi:putative transposase
MKGKRFSEREIIQILKEAEVGTLVPSLCRQRGFSRSTFYKWNAKYGGMEASDLKRLHELEAENRHLKQMYAELSLEHHLLSFWARPKKIEANKKARLPSQRTLAFSQIFHFKWY